MRLFAFLGASFLLIPLIEIALFISIGGQIGALATIAIVITTGVIGATVISRQGISVVETIRRDLAEDRLPVRPVIDGAMLLCAALLLITPGFATDAIGFALAVPPFRRWIAGVVQRAVHVTVVSGTPGSEAPGYGDTRGGRGPNQVIEGEIVREGPANDSPWRP